MSTTERAKASEPAVGSIQAPECCMVDPQSRNACKIAELCRDAGKEALAHTIDSIVTVRRSRDHKSEDPISMKPSEVIAHMPEDATRAVVTRRTSDATKLLTQFDGFEAEGASHKRRYVINVGEFSQSCIEHREVVTDGLRVTSNTSKKPKRSKPTHPPLDFTKVPRNPALTQALFDCMRNSGQDTFVDDIYALLGSPGATCGNGEVYVAGKRAIRQAIHHPDYIKSRDLYERVHALSEILKRAFYELPVYTAAPTKEDIEWMKHAACHGLDPDIFLPSDGVGVDRAKEYCNGCKMAELCLDFAIEHKIDKGVWGGTSERERRRIVKQRREKAATVTDQP